MDSRTREILASLQYRSTQAVQARRDPRQVRAQLKCLVITIQSSLREQEETARPILAVWREVLAKLDPEHAQTYRTLMQEDSLRSRIDQLFHAVSAAAEIECDKTTASEVLGFCQLLADQTEYALQQAAETDSVLPTRLGRPVLRLIRAS